MGILMPPGVSKAQARWLPRLPSLMRSWYPTIFNAGVNSSQFTLASLWELEGEFSLVRFVYVNRQTGSGYAIPAACLAPSSAVGDGVTPVNAAGTADNTLFQSVYFNNGGSDVLPQDQTVWGSGVTSLTVGSAANANRSLLAFSDWMRVPSIPRGDGHPTRYLLARHLTDTAGTFQSANLNTGYVGWGTTPFRDLQAFYQQGVDAVTTPSALTSPTRGVYLSPHGVQYVSSLPGMSVLLVGDSLTQGFGASVSQCTGWGYLACAALTTPGRPISCWNQGWQGQQSLDYWANGYTAFKASRPDVVTIPVWTPNDGLTQATADASWSRAQDLAAYVMKNGATPVFMGPLPWAGISTGTVDAIRLGVREKMLNASQYGVKVLDWEPCMGTGGSPNQIVPAYLASDGLHPNDLGNQIMDQQVFRPVLRSLLY